MSTTGSVPRQLPLLPASDFCQRRFRRQEGADHASTRMCTLRVFFRNVPQLTSCVFTVTVNFTTVANADLVSVDVQRVLNAVRGKLPVDAGVPSVNRIDRKALPPWSCQASKR